MPSAVIGGAGDNPRDSFKYFHMTHPFWTTLMRFQASGDGVPYHLAVCRVVYSTSSACNSQTTRQREVVIARKRPNGSRPAPYAVCGVPAGGRADFAQAVPVCTSFTN